MKKIILLTLFVWFLQLSIKSQDLKKDNRPQKFKEDSRGNFQSDIITTIDFLQAMELIGLKIHKFDIGTFNQEYSLHFILKEYSNGEIVTTDTIMNIDNTYSFYEGDVRYLDFINQIKIFTQQEKDQLKIKISTYGKSLQTKIDYEVSDIDQNYFVRYYSNTSWVENTDIPLFVFASSWKDEKYGFYRFCGSTQLDDKDDDTKTLLKLSPHYFKWSYIISR
jgi:hypothetical protein